MQFSQLQTWYYNILTFFKQKIKMNDVKHLLNMNIIRHRKKKLININKIKLTA